MDNPARQQAEEFLYFEAELLDDRRLRQWLELFTDDARYCMPIRYNPLDRSDDVTGELSNVEEAYYFNDTKDSLRVRVERTYSNQAWAEMPPSRTRRLITNVRVKNDRGAAIEVHSNFIVYRTRMEKDQDMFVGARHDVLRRLDGGLKISRRTIILDQAVLAAKNISIFL